MTAAESRWHKLRISVKKMSRPCHSHGHVAADSPTCFLCWSTKDFKLDFLFVFCQIRLSNHPFPFFLRIYLFCLVEQKGRLKPFPLSRVLPGLFLASGRMHLVGLTVCAPRLNVGVDAYAFPRVYSSLESLILGSSHCAEDTVPTSVLVLVTHIPITHGDRSPLPDMCFLVDDLAISSTSAGVGLDI